MPVRSDILLDPWRPLSYPDFAGTQYLLHMGSQAVGKLKLKAPFLPQWSAALLWITARGLTTGPIDYAGGAYEVSADLISHEVIVQTIFHGPMLPGRFVGANVTMASPGFRQAHLMVQTSAENSVDFRL